MLKELSCNARLSEKIAIIAEGNVIDGTEEVQVVGYNEKVG